MAVRRARGHLHRRASAAAIGRPSGREHPAAKLSPTCACPEIRDRRAPVPLGQCSPRARAGRERRRPLRARLARRRAVAPAARSLSRPLRARLALHIIVAPRRGEAESMWFDARDARDLRVIAANFLGRTRDYPAFGKYDPLQKLYHAFLTLLAAGSIFSGAYLLISAEAWATFSHAWMRDMRLVHDVAGFAFIAILIGHVYFGVIRVNWPQLVAMCDRTASRFELQPVSRRAALARRARTERRARMQRPKSIGIGLSDEGPRHAGFGLAPGAGSRPWRSIPPFVHPGRRRRRRRRRRARRRGPAAAAAARESGSLSRIERRSRADLRGHRAARQRGDARAAGPASAHAAPRTSRGPRPDRNEEILQPRSMRRLHGADGRPARLLLHAARTRRGRREITTIEGISQGRRAASGAGRLRPSHGQSVRTLHARDGHVRRRAHQQNPRPTPDDVRLALSGNLCRCGNYRNEIAAVLSARVAQVDLKTPLQPRFCRRIVSCGEIGPAALVESNEGVTAKVLRSTVPALDAREKATGAARFAGDIGFHPDDQPRNVLHAKVVRSPYALADVEEIDDSAARSVAWLPRHGHVSRRARVSQRSTKPASVPPPAAIACS